MRPLKLFRRADDRPPLKERLAELKARIARVTRRPDGSPDQQRRIMLAGSLAAAFPLPALASIDVRHPDRALFEIVARMHEAEGAYEAAHAAFNAAWTAAEADIGPCPREILLGDPDEDRGRFTSMNAPRHVRRDPPRFRFVDERGEAWTADGLRKALRYAVAVYGPGGRTPHRCRRYRALLPIAETFDARCTAAEEQHRTAALAGASRATYQAWFEAQEALHETAAHTPEGLALIVRHVSACGVDRMPANWRNLLVSAANVADVDLADIVQRDAPRRIL